MRIGLIGLQHETNTFVDAITHACDFEAPSGWPKQASGASMIQALQDTSVATAGALRALQEAGGTPVPILWAMALPSGPVDHGAFEGFVTTITETLRQVAPLDGVFLELHGAMVTTELDDAEGALLSAVRNTVGPDVPMVASLDLHANLSQTMIETADCLEAYLTYPHIDMAQTGHRAMERLLSLCPLSPAMRPAKAYRSIPFLLPLIAQATQAAPVDALYTNAQQRVEDGQADGITLTLGFPLADIEDAGPAVAVYADTQHRADSIADDIVDEWIAKRVDFNAQLFTPCQAIGAARSIAAGEGPIVLADVQDNPGGGGSNDTTGLLHALVDEAVEGAVVVHIVDPHAVDAAHAAGVYGTLDCAIGGLQDPSTGEPVPGPWAVLALGDGSFVGEGPMYHGNSITLGPVALVERNGVACILAKQRMQASEPALLRHLGLEPEALQLLVVKSSVHFRGAYQDMARDILHVGAPGRVPMDLSKLEYKKCHRKPV